MGLNSNNAKLLAYLSFKYKIFANSVLTLGNQTFRVDKKSQREIIGFLEANRIYNKKNFHFDSTFEYFKMVFDCKELKSIDASNYQDSDHVYNLNEPIPDDVLPSMIDFIYDGGTLEHIFNIQSVILNIKHLLKIGGYVFFSNPVNSNSGHGLYQFSPDFYFSTFTLDNGFKILDISYYDMFTKKNYIIPNPLELKKRIPVPTINPSYINVLVQKVTDTEKLSVVQSDYKIIWSNKKRNPTSHRIHKLRAKYMYFDKIIVKTPYRLKFFLRLYILKKKFKTHPSSRLI